MVVVVVVVVVVVAVAVAVAAAITFGILRGLIGLGIREIRVQGLGVYALTLGLSA